MRTVVEVVLDLSTGAAEEVDHSSLLDEVVLSVETHVLHLLLGVDEMSHLELLSHISPLGSELLGLVSSVCIVENSKLGTGKPSEVTGLDVTEIEGDQELVMEDHTSDPLVVGPTSEAGDRDNGADVAEHEKETTTGAGEGLVVRGDLLRTDGFEQGLHVVVVGVDQGVSFSVVRVNVAGLHFVELVLVVGLTVFFLVLGFVTTIGFRSYKRVKLTPSYEPCRAIQYEPGRRPRICPRCCRRRWPWCELGQAPSFFGGRMLILLTFLF